MAYKTERRKNQVNNTPNPEFPRQNMFIFRVRCHSYYSQLVKKVFPNWEIASLTISIFSIYGSL